MPKSPGRVKDVISLALVIGGLTILAVSFAYSSRPAQPVPVMGSADHVPTEVEDFLSPESFTFEIEPDLEGSAIIALFVLNPTVCPPCLNEVQEYASLIAGYNEAGANIGTLALVFERDERRALHFIRTTALPLPAGYGYPETLAAELGRHDDETTLLQQLVFVDRRHELLFYRVPLPNSGTPLEEKEKVLHHVLSIGPKGLNITTG